MLVPPACAAPLPRLEITTSRLRLIADNADLALAVYDFACRNRAHFAPWNPPTPESFYTVETQAQRLQQGMEAFRAETNYRYWMIDTTHSGGARLPLPEIAVIGCVHFSQISRGAFHNALLGYSLDETHVGRGWMTEALTASIAEMFSPRVNLHRMQAAYRPENRRSAAVLRRLGFRVEGLAANYLFINGAWRDHCISALTNPHFIRPPDWPHPSA